MRIPRAADPEETTAMPGLTIETLLRLAFVTLATLVVTLVATDGATLVDPARPPFRASGPQASVDTTSSKR